MKTTQMKIIVIDNDQKFHETYSEYFKTYSGYCLKGIYTTVQEALDNYEITQPDVIISEVSLTQLSGIEGIKLLRKKDPNVSIIMASSKSDFEIIKKAFKNRANGYLTKPLTRKRLLRALNSVKYEGAALSSDIAKKIITMFHGKDYQIFSDRENEIVEFLGQGATYKTIADKLFVTPSTVNFHIQNIYLKLDVNSRSEALQKLREMESSREERLAS